MKHMHYLLAIGCICVGLIGHTDVDAAEAWLDTSLPASQRADALLAAMTLEEKTSQMHDQAVAIPRLKISEYNWWNEALHGVARNGRATVFPQAIGLAATFDEGLALREATAISDEARAKFVVARGLGNHSRYAGLTFWTPNINIFRDPRWGRGQETYGEDPYLTAQIGMAFVRGLQGNHPKYLKAAACAKHYAVHSGPEALRHEFNAVVSLRDLWDTYLPAFEALVVDAKVEAVMGAYNRVLGQACSASPFLLTDILRKQWGFEGHIVSDCWALNDIWQDHKLAATPEEACAMAIKAGLNLNCGDAFIHLNSALKKGLLTEAEIDRALKPLLVTQIKLGLLDPLEANPYNHVDPSVVGSSAHVALAREVAAKSIVMVKNSKGLLPLKKNLRRIYVNGPQASNAEVLLGNYYGLSDQTINILDGIVGRVSLGTTINYKYGVLPFQENVNPIDWTTEESKQSDVMIAVLGLSGLIEGEEGEAIASATKGDRFELGLPQSQVNFVKKLKQDTKTPLVVIITGGSPIAIPEILQLADAVLFVWYPGQEGGRAVADVVFGDTNPGGRLPFTVPHSLDDLPPYENYAMKGRTYRYMEKAPFLPFGFGLSFTTFSYDAPQIVESTHSQNDPMLVRCRVSNTGNRAGDEVLQLYLVQPGAGITAPLRKLVGFRRIHLLPGASATVEFTVERKQLGQFTDAGLPVVLAGQYKLIVAGACPIPRAVELGAAQPEEVQFSIQ